MSRKVGQIIARGERRWLVRVYLGRDREMRKRIYHNRTIYGSLRHAQAYTLDEIAKILGQTKGNIRHHSFRGLEQLRKLIFAGKSPGTRAV